MKRTIGNIDQDISTNKFKLEEECEMQADIYRYYAKKVAELKADRDAAIRRLNLKKAQVELDIFHNPPTKKNKKGEDIEMKLTGSIISAMVLRNKQVIKLDEEVSKYKKEVSILETAEKALEHKKSMLSNLTKLYLGGYYSKPAGEQGENINDQVSQGITNQLNRRKNNGKEKEEKEE